MSIFDKIFSKAKKVKVKSIDFSEASGIVNKLKVIIETLQRDLADGKLDIGELIGLISLIVGLFKIADNGQPEE